MRCERSRAVGRPGREVVHQGVVGWSSLHTRRYLESDSAPLDPDLPVLYLGHDDLEPATPTMHHAWERHRSRHGWVTGASGPWGRSPALSGLRCALLARRVAIREETRWPTPAGAVP